MKEKRRVPAYSHRVKCIRRSLQVPLTHRMVSKRDFIILRMRPATDPSFLISLTLHVGIVSTRVDTKVP